MSSSYARRYEKQSSCGEMQGDGSRCREMRGGTRSRAPAGRCSEIGRDAGRCEEVREAELLRGDMISRCTEMHGDALLLPMHAKVRSSPAAMGRSTLTLTLTLALTLTLTLTLTLALALALTLT